MNLRTLRAYIIGLAAWVLVFVLALKVGAAGDVDADIIAQLRLPRAILGTAVGIGLAVAGATLQALFSNPLCEPYTLGVSSGSALGAVIGASLGLEAVFSGMAGTAFIGALVFAAVLYAVSMRPSIGVQGLLLTGVMLGFLGSGLVTLWIALSDANGVQSALVWLFGDLSRARLQGSLLTLISISLLVLGIWSRWRDLDALLTGEEGALALGIPVKTLRRRLIVQSSVLIALCVAGAGMIGFVGLVVPHFARRWVGSLHARLIPLCAIWGAVALVAADSLARTIAKPYELPVGVMTSLIGAPIFLWILLSRRKLA